MTGLTSKSRGHATQAHWRVLAPALLLAGCGSTVLLPGRDPGPDVRALLAKHDYHAAMRLLPAAMAECEREARRTGYSVDVHSGSLDAFVQQTTAVEGDAEWGAILDDPDIPHRYKTALLSEVIELRLGKGSVYCEDGERYVVPASGPIDLDEHWKQLGDNANCEPAHPTDAARQPRR